MNDLDDFDDDDDGFFGDDPVVAEADRPWGLVVSEPALMVNDDKGHMLYDELALIESAYRRDDYSSAEREPDRATFYAGMRPPVLFDGNDYRLYPDGKPSLGDPDNAKNTDIEMWKKFLRLDREPTYQEADDALRICWMLFNNRVGTPDNLASVGRAMKLDRVPTMEEALVWVAANRY